MGYRRVDKTDSTRRRTIISDDMEEGLWIVIGIVLAIVVMIMIFVILGEFEFSFDPFG